MSPADKALLAVLAAAGGGVWLWFALSTRISFEDAYITFRYARNIAQGNGFVYNIGERVLGTTTPLQTLLLAGLGAAIGPSRIPTIAAFLMPLFGLAAGLLTYPALVRLGLPRPGAAAGCLLFYLHPLVIRTSLGGMETPLLLFLMALSLHFLARKQSVAAAAAIALLALCRVDGLIWGFLLLAVSLLSSYRKPVRQVVALGAVVLPWLLFAYLYFGSPVPNTMLAKGVIRPGREGLLVDPVHFSRLSRFYLSGTGFEADHRLFPFWLALLALGLYAVLRAKRRELLVLAIFPPLYAVLMYLGRAPKYEWYVLPILFCCLLLAGAGLGAAVSWAARGRADRRLRAAAAACVTAALFFGAFSLVRELPAKVRHARRFQENEVGLRQRVGLWLRGNTPGDATVAMEAIGYQGYYSERRVIDMAGLITPQVIAYKAGTGSNGAVFMRILKELAPDYLVLRSFEVDENRHFNGGKLFETDADREFFFDHYRESRRFTAPHPEHAPTLTRLTIFERRPARNDQAPVWSDTRRARTLTPLC